MEIMGHSMNTTFLGTPILSCFRAIPLELFPSMPSAGKLPHQPQITTENISFYQSSTLFGLWITVICFFFIYAKTVL